MTYRLTELAVDIVRAYLEAHFDDELETIEDEIDDGIELDAIGTWSVVELGAIQKFPALLILGDRVTFGYDADDAMDSSSELTLAIMATSMNAEELRRKLYRYIAAMVRCLKAARLDTTFAGIGVEFISADYEPLLANGSAFLADARLLIRVTINEIGG